MIKLHLDWATSQARQSAFLTDPWRQLHRLSSNTRSLFVVSEFKRNDLPLTQTLSKDSATPTPLFSQRLRQTLPNWLSIQGERRL